MYQPPPCRVNRDPAGGRWPRGSGSRLTEDCLLEERNLTAVQESYMVEAEGFEIGRGVSPRSNQIRDHTASCGTAIPHARASWCEDGCAEQ